MKKSKVVAATLGEGGGLRATPRGGSSHPRRHLGSFAGHSKGGGCLRATPIGGQGGRHHL
jgi:hypothetical protein